MTVKTILSRKGGDVVTIEPTADIATATKLLAQRGIGALVVCGSDRRLAGILSERDVVRLVAERGPASLQEPVAQVMTRKVVTCTQEETIASIMERMTTGKFRHVPIIEQDCIVGIVSIGDMVKHRLEVMERESAALRDYIRTA